MVLSCGGGGRAVPCTARPDKHYTGLYIIPVLKKSERSVYMYNIHKDDYRPVKCIEVLLHNSYKVYLESVGIYQSMVKI